jgi:spermidine synthase
VSSAAPTDAGWRRRIVLAVAVVAGASAMAYEVLWFRVLTVFVDTSIHSFAIMLTAFLGGLAAGSYGFSRFADTRRDPLLFLGALEVSVGPSCLLAIPLVARLTRLVAAATAILGTTPAAEIASRFLAFSVALLVPTALMGAALPAMSRIVARETAPVGRAMAVLYGAHTAGGVLGALGAGFSMLPALGVQASLVVVSTAEALAGCVCVLAAPTATWQGRRTVAAACAVAFAVVVASIPHDALLSIYSERYAPPAHELLYLRENVSGTTAVFREAGRDRRYLLIDGRGEVSTDHFSMRAFRLLALLPAFYAPSPKNALVVTFGSGIVAGSIASLPGLEHAECVEICAEALEAAKYFAPENHDVLANPKIRFVIDDGRNYLLTTHETYDIISADATHPASGDSWVLYTREFYEQCAQHLTDRGVMSQWLPMHGLSERDFLSVAETFHAAFPFVALYYAGGFKTMGHVVLLGSNQPLRIHVPSAEALFLSEPARTDLESVNVFGLPDLFSGFVTDQEGLEALAGGVPLNTDDKPVVVFSSGGRRERHMGLGSLVGVRKSIFPALTAMEEPMASQVRSALEGTFAATGLALEAQILEGQEYAQRTALDLDHPTADLRLELARDREMLEQVLRKYGAALEANPRDAETRYLMLHAAAEYRSLEALTAQSPP